MCNDYLSNSVIFLRNIRYSLRKKVLLEVVKLHYKSNSVLPVKTKFNFGR